LEPVSSGAAGACDSAGVDAAADGAAADGAAAEAAGDDEVEEVPQAVNTITATDSNPNRRFFINCPPNGWITQGLPLWTTTCTTPVHETHA
jgi:hypothetical protein